MLTVIRDEHASFHFNPPPSLRAAVTEVLESRVSEKMENLHLKNFIGPLNVEICFRLHHIKQTLNIMRSTLSSRSLNWFTKYKSATVRVQFQVNVLYIPSLVLKSTSSFPN